MQTTDRPIVAMHSPRRPRWSAAALIALLGYAAAVGAQSPATPGYPTTPTTPITPGTPGTPSYPTTPTYPGTPTNSGTPSYPGSPSYPTTPAYPGASGDPGSPTSGYPTTPSYPSTPGYPTTPTYPTTPSYPGAGGSYPGSGGSYPGSATGAYGTPTTPGMNDAYGGSAVRSPSTVLRSTTGYSSAPSTGGGWTAPSVPGMNAAPSTAAGGCTLRLSTDRSSVALINRVSNDAYKQVALGEVRVQKVFQSPDSSWAVAVYKIRGEAEFGFMAFDLNACQEQLPVELPALADQAQFEGAEVVLSTTQGSRRFKLANGRMQ